MKDDRLKDDRLKDDDMIETIRIMAPGTILREGLENILRARTGALIVIGDSSEVMSIVDGGFTINKDYTSAQLYELAKMDGAIVISKDMKKILYANALLIPDHKIPTNETGTRHKTAERVAKQTKEIVICISQRRNIITLFRDNKKYILRDTPNILAKSNQALQTLEKYKAVLDTSMNNLNLLEFEDIVMLDDVAYVIQRTEMVLRIAVEIEKYICELGNEGRLISMQLEELLANVEKNCMLIIEDYIAVNTEIKAEEVYRQIKTLIYDDLMNVNAICSSLGYSIGVTNYDFNVSPKGYRIMSKIPRLPISIVNNLVNEFNDFKGILSASIEELDDVEGIGEVRARAIREGLKRAQEQMLLDSRQFMR